jgi:hypothetical protein
MPGLTEGFQTLPGRGRRFIRPKIDCDDALCQPPIKRGLDKRIESTTEQANANDTGVS